MGKDLIITENAIKEFKTKKLKMSHYTNDIKTQIEKDLKILNRYKIEQLEKNRKKITTKQGKVYIVEETDKRAIVLSCYKTKINFF